MKKIGKTCCVYASTICTGLITIEILVYFCSNSRDVIALKIGSDVKATSKVNSLWQET